MARKFLIKITEIRARPLIRARKQIEKESVLCQDDEQWVLDRCANNAVGAIDDEAKIADETF